MLLSSPYIDAYCRSLLEKFKATCQSAFKSNDMYFRRRVIRRSTMAQTPWGLRW
jgi:hypothetical protein